MVEIFLIAVSLALDAFAVSVSSGIAIPGFGWKQAVKMGLWLSLIHIYLLNEQKMKGVAVVLVGEDLDVLLELCDRILVLCGGKVSGIVDGRTATKEEVGLYMTHVGGGKEEA